MTQPIASAIPSWPAAPTTATSAAASSEPTISKPASVAIANTGSAANSPKNTRRIGWP